MAEPRTLRQGERVDVPTVRQRLHIEGRNPGPFSAFNALVLPLGADGRLAAALAPVLAANGAAGDGPVRFIAGEGMEIDLAAVPDAIQRLAVVLYVIGGPSRAIGIDHCGAITVTITGGLHFVLETTGRRESALILVEYYRRSSGWRLSTLGQVRTTGIVGIERALRSTLDVPDARGGGPGADGDLGAPPRPPAGSSGGGSGFAVAPLLLVTNHHVIDGAQRLRVQAGHSQSEARVVAEDPVNDIALLAMDQPAQAIARFRSDLDVDLGEDLVVAGFPLQGLLGQGPQITGGNVSALTGLRGDATILQFTCPIGSGSSGGPVMDSHGLIVGLVRSVLRTDLDHAPVAQNINFGVKAAVVRSFLHAAGVAPAVAPAGPPVPRAELARQARAFLYRIEVGY